MHASVFGKGLAETSPRALLRHFLVMCVPAFNAVHNVYNAGPWLIGPMEDIKTYISNHFSNNMFFFRCSVLHNSSWSMTAVLEANKTSTPVCARSPLYTCTTVRVDSKR